MPDSRPDAPEFPPPPSAAPAGARWLPRPGAARPAPVSEHHPADFVQALFAVTPRVYVTPALLGLNALVFVAMVASGVSLLTPQIPELLRWGANYGPYTLGGQWYRLLSSTFVHVGLVHLLFNMYVLQDAGRVVERLLGHSSFLVLYLLAGLGGALLSTTAQPTIVSAGASGAVFGVYGGLFGFLLRQRRALPQATLRRFFRTGGMFLACNVAFGFLVEGIDVFAHVGGLITGFGSGLLLATPLRRERRAAQRWRALAVGAAGLAVVVATTWASLGRVSALDAELERLRATESRVLHTYNSAATKAREGRLSDAEFSRTLRRDVLPPWRRARHSFEALADVPESQRGLHAGLVQYMGLREQAWSLLARAAEQGDPELLRRATEKQAAADARLGQLQPDAP